MFFLQFESRPDPTHDAASELGGAFVNCWVAIDDDRDEAEAIAREQMAEELWIPLEVVEAYPVERSDYADGDSGLEHFQRALVDGLAMMIHTYPLDEEPEAGGAD